MKTQSATYYARILFELSLDVTPVEIDTLLSVYLDYLKREKATHLLVSIVKTLEANAKEWSLGPVVHIRTAREVSAEQLQAIAHMIESDARYTHTVDEQLLGGFTATGHSVAIDASLKQILRSLQTTLVS